MTTITLPQTFNNESLYQDKTIFIEVPLNEFNKEKFKKIGDYHIQFGRDYSPYISIETDEKFIKDWYLNYIIDSSGQVLEGIRFQMEKGTYTFTKFRDVFRYQYQEIIDKYNDFAVTKIKEQEPLYTDRQIGNVLNKLKSIENNQIEYNKKRDTYTTSIVEKSKELIANAEDETVDKKVLKEELVESGMEFIKRFTAYRPH